MHTKLETYITTVISRFETIGEERQVLLQSMAQSIAFHDDVALNFICTHNSRRSHYGQIWSAIAADYYGYSIQTFSGGTEVTAFNPNAIASLVRAGLIAKKLDGSNPKVELYFSDSAKPLVCFSKLFDDEANPNKNFLAVMTCSEANEKCPFVPGALKRIPLTYEDPKISDGTTEQNAMYDERCLQIATEMFYLFSLLKK